MRPAEIDRRGVRIQSCAPDPLRSITHILRTPDAHTGLVEHRVASITESF